MKQLRQGVLASRPSKRFGSDSLEPPSAAGEVLYDNSLEPSYESLRGQRRRRVLLSTAVLLAGLAIVNLVTAGPALMSMDPTLLALWLVGTAAFGVPLVWGMGVERASPLDVRVTARGVKAPGFRWVPVEALEGAELVDRGTFLVVRRAGGGPRRPVLSVWSRELSDSTKFKAALQSLLRREG